MDDSKSIVDELIDDSRHSLTLTESRAFREGRLRELDLAPAAVRIAASPDYRAYHLLMAVRRASEESYERIPESVRSAVLCSAFEHARSFNDWGYLDPGGGYDGPAATALTALGMTALGCLTPLLDDKRSAELLGSEMATISQLYNYRRADFAYRYVCLALDLPYSFEAEPRDRDGQIDRLKTRLAGARQS
jgi:hypothetical protein